MATMRKMRTGPAPARATPPDPLQPKPSSGATLEEQIRQRAYQLYLERGAANGDAEEDWLRAEAEIRGRMRIA